MAAQASAASPCPRQRSFGLRQLAERRAGAIEQGLPTDLLAPLLQTLAVDPLGLVVVEDVVDAMLFQPRARFLHRVANLDPIDCDRFGHMCPPGFACSTEP